MHSLTDGPLQLSADTVQTQMLDILYAVPLPSAELSTMNSIAPSMHAASTIRKPASRTLPPLDRVLRTADHSKEREFTLMQAAFEKTGGLVSGTDAAHRISRHCDQPISKLARWIVDRTVVSLQWRSGILVPMFQFELCRMTLREPVAQVVRELTGVFDMWETALWFAEPNNWLAGRPPLELVLDEPQLVLEASRADRFVAKG